MNTSTTGGMFQVVFVVVFLLLLFFFFFFHLFSRLLWFQAIRCSDNFPIVLPFALRSYSIGPAFRKHTDIGHTAVCETHTRLKKGTAK